MRDFDIRDFFAVAREIVESELAEHLNQYDLHDETICFGFLAETNLRLFEVLLGDLAQQD